MSLAATIEAMAAAGCSVEQIAAVARSLEDAKNATRAARNRRYQEKAKTLKTPQDAQDVLKGVPPVPPIDSITLTPLTPSPKSKLRLDTREALIEILKPALSEQTASDLIAHRKAKRAPMTAGAARALVKQLIDFGDPERAALAMMANGWTGFKADWMPASSKPVLVASRPEPGARPNGRFYAMRDSPQWQAWARYRGRSPPADANGGWFFEAEWPPAEKAQA